ncbi:MAG: hypothetical protein ACOYXB_09700, partial [Bacteroidota bacterium]
MLTYPSAKRIHTMKTGATIIRQSVKFILMVFLALNAQQVKAQPTWAVYPENWAYNGEVDAVVILNSTDLTSGILGAFVGEECRGLATEPLYPTPSGRYVYSIFVYSNLTPGETMTFRFYNNLDGQTYDIQETVDFVSNMVLGDLFAPLEFHALGNNAPVVDLPISDQSFNAGFGSSTLDISSVFSDPDSDPLSFSASSSDEGVVTVSISGTTLTITEVSHGTSTITVTADDGSLNVSDDFVVDVNGAPSVISPLSDLSLNEGYGTSTVELAGVFSDPESDPLSYSASSSNEGILTVSISGTTLTITEVSYGTASVTITASDGALSADDIFSVFVNGAPTVTSPLGDLTFNVGFTTTTVELAGVFSDPDSDPMTYTAGSSDEGVVTVSVSGTTLTINEIGAGSATITVTADDGSLSVSDQFAVLVNSIPVVATPLSDLTLDEHFATTTVDLTGVFTDIDAGDVLTLTATSSDEGVVSVSVSGTTLTITEVGLGT